MKSTAPPVLVIVASILGAYWLGGGFSGAENAAAGGIFADPGAPSGRRAGPKDFMALSHAPPPEVRCALDRTVDQVISEHKHTRGAGH